MEEKLGAYLVKSGVLTEDQLRTAIQEKRETGQRLVSVLNRLEMVSEGKLLARWGNDQGIDPPVFLAPHVIGIDSSGDIYVGEVAKSSRNVDRGARTILKFTRVA